MSPFHYAPVCGPIGDDAQQNFVMRSDHQKTRVTGLSEGGRILTICLAVVTQYQSVTTVAISILRIAFTNDRERALKILFK